jgi:hypothetical protein
MLYEDVLAILIAFEVRYDLPVVFVPTAQAGARRGKRKIFYPWVIPIKVLISYQIRDGLPFDTELIL